MKETKNIASEEIRKKIDDWYSGATDSDRDAFLFAYFSETAPEEIPEDLKEEAEIFSLLALKGSQCPDTDLMREINIAVENEKKSRGWLKIRHFATWLSAAACLSAIIFGINHFKISNDLHSRPVETETSLAKTVPEPKLSDTTNYIAPVVTSDRIAVNSTSTSKRTKRSQVREVTDVNEALAILRLVDSKLSNTMSAGVEAMNSAEDEIRMTDEITCKVLNSLSI